MAPERCPCLYPENLCLCWKEAFRCDLVRDLTLGRLPGGPLVISSSQEWEAGGQKQR